MNPRSTSSGQASTPLRTGSVIDALDRIDEINACFEAVGDLMNPEPDLHAVNRDKQSILLAMLARELAAGLGQLDHALQQTQSDRVKGR